MDDGFYRAFEDRYRGSRALISERLEVYLPFLMPLKALYEDAQILDLGCGRGEWLELMGRKGFQASGVDLDDGMLEACQALGLPARKDDALSALQKLPDSSQIAVTGFHIAEHIPFPVLQQIIAEALRVLRPAGLLILETPNAESLVVGTNSFYLDPTHERPLPNLLLSFLTEYSGFIKSKIVRLQESAALHDDNAAIGVWGVLSGTSPDYAVIAQKQAQPDLLSAFDAVFDASYGLSLDQLAVRYDQALQSRISGLEDSFQAGRADYLNALGSIQNLHAEQLLLIQERHDRSVHAERAKADALQVELNNSLGNAHNWYLRAIAYEEQVQAMQASTSWRITRPLRVVVRLVSWPFRSQRAPVKQVVRRAVIHANRWLSCRPAIRRRLFALLRHTPGLRSWLQRVYVKSLNPDPSTVVSDPQQGVIDHAPLTQRGRSIETALRDAMNKGQK
jgi:O-antigen chain-terminating methyltransferase